MADADLVSAAGTEFGPTDYDGYSDGGFVLPANLIRIDIGADQLARRPATVSIQAECAEALEALLLETGHVPASEGGSSRAAAARKAAFAELNPTLQGQVRAVEMSRELYGAISFRNHGSTGMQWPPTPMPGARIFTRGWRLANPITVRVSTATSSQMCENSLASAMLTSR